MQGNINSNQFGKQSKVSAQAFKSKASTKREVYRLLSVDGGFYMAPYDVITIFHMKDMMCGKVLRIKAEQVKHCEVPRVDNNYNTKYDISFRNAQKCITFP